MFRLGNLTLEPGARYERAQVQGPLFVRWTQQPGQLYSIVMWDDDAPRADADRSLSPLLHYLVVNAEADRMEDGTGDVLMGYEPPNPPKGSDYHRYHVEVFRQRARVRPIEIEKRTNFPVRSFVRHLGEKVAEISFYARRR